MRGTTGVHPLTTDRHGGRPLRRVTMAFVGADLCVRPHDDHYTHDSHPHPALRATFPIPFVPSGHFPLIRGIGPRRGSQEGAFGAILLASPCGGGAQCAHWAERAAYPILCPPRMRSFTVPEVGRSRPLKCLESVVLPLPLSPTMAVTLSCGIVRSIPSSTLSECGPSY